MGVRLVSAWPGSSAVDRFSASSRAEGRNRPAVVMARGAWLLRSQSVGSRGPAGAQGWRYRSGALKVIRYYLVVASAAGAGVSGEPGPK